jgi:hypothetical protein
MVSGVNPIGVDEGDPPRSLRHDRGDRACRVVAEWCCVSVVLCVWSKGVMLEKGLLEEGY